MNFYNPVLAGRKMYERQGGSKHGFSVNYHQDHRISARIQVTTRQDMFVFVCDLKKCARFPEQ